jgi:16S rRNA (adenine1518-N6/adenine1519-N6)-dimethyltransferase
MVGVLNEKFLDEVERGKLKIIEGEALGEMTNDKFQITNKIHREDYAIVGNIPYYITGHLLRVIGEMRYKPKQTVLLIQEEVAQRVCARKGNMNLLSASVGGWADARVVTRVPRGMFSPPPKVDSAVIVLDTHNIEHRAWNVKQDIYFECVHAIFKQPRRTVIKNLVDAGVARETAEKVLREIKLLSTARPQDVSIEDIIELSGLFSA